MSSAFSQKKNKKIYDIKYDQNIYVMLLEIKAGIYHVKNLIKRMMHRVRGSARLKGDS